MIGKAMAAIRRRGLADFLQYHLGTRFRKYVWSSRPCTIIYVPTKDYRFRFLRRRGFCDIIKIESPEQLAEWSHPSIDAKRGFMNRWISRGDHYFLGVKDGRPVGFVDLSMVDFRDREGLRVEVDGSRGECKVRDIQVFPEFRKTAAVGVLHDVVIEWAQNAGFEHVLGAIYIEKGVALKASKKLGFREIKRVQCKRLFHCISWQSEVWSAPSYDQAREMTWEVE